MAVRRAKPSMKAGVRKAALPKPAAVIYEPPAQRVSKPFEQTATPRTRGETTEGTFRAAAAPLPAVRQRGSKFGTYTAPDDAEEEHFEFPQIDPTRSINPQRPRTLQAGYYRQRDPLTNRLEPTGTLRVRFRDGTPWEYHDVPPRVWQNFRRVQSPGRFINRVLNNYPYNRGDF